jgi:hypothetical protein
MLISIRWSRSPQETPTHLTCPNLPFLPRPSIGPDRPYGAPLTRSRRRLGRTLPRRSSATKSPRRGPAASAQRLVGHGVDVAAPVGQYRPLTIKHFLPQR